MKKDKTLFIFGLILLIVGVASALFSFWQQYILLEDFWMFEDIVFNLRTEGIFTFFAGIFALIIDYRLEGGENGN